MKTRSWIAALAMCAFMASCESAPTVCKDGQYCAKCKMAFIQTGPPTKISSTVQMRKNCPTCGGQLMGCTVCQ